MAAMSPEVARRHSMIGAQQHCCVESAKLAVVVFLQAHPRVRGHGRSGSYPTALPIARRSSDSATATPFGDCQASI